MGMQTYKAKTFNLSDLNGISNQTLEMPTWGLARSCSRSPVAYNIACEAPCDFGSVNCALNLFNRFVIVFSSDSLTVPATGERGSIKGCGPKSISN